MTEYHDDGAQLTDDEENALNQVRRVLGPLTAEEVSAVKAEMNRMRIVNIRNLLALVRSMRPSLDDDRMGGGP